VKDKAKLVVVKPGQAVCLKNGAKTTCLRFDPKGKLSAFTPKAVAAKPAVAPKAVAKKF
jgi:hypothetical protein